MINLEWTGGVDVWKFDLDLLPARQRSLEKWLSQNEMGQASGMRRKLDRSRFLARRGLLREILGAYLDMPPDEIAFNRDRWGKPYVVVAGRHPLQFNTSSSGGVGLIAIREKGSLGIDVEAIEPGFPWEDLANQVLRTEEVQAIAERDPAQRVDDFYAIWTRKEALAKAVGLGLNLDLLSLKVPAGQRLSGWFPCSVRLLEREIALSLIDLWVGAEFRAALALAGQEDELRFFTKSASGETVGTW